VSDLLELIAGHVRVRFPLTLEAFAARVRELAQTHSGASGRSLRDQAARLSLDDLYLATACLESDERAWSELATTHFEFMREFPRRFLASAAARDVADEVIADLWERGKLRQYEGRSTLRTWLGTVVAHAALNSRKSMTRLVPLDSESARVAEQKAARFESVEPENEQAAVLLRQMFSEAVRGLPPESRLLLQLYYEQGLTLEQLSVAMHASSAALSRRLKRTREELRDSIESLSRRQTGASALALRDGLDLARIELDLGKLLGGESVPTGERYEVV
jgi:RNA polymerase sigma factor (sigma-70 family)